MLVLITGMMRSGSTFTFNVAKHLLTSGGETAFWEATEHLEESLKAQGHACDHLIFKQHLGDDFSRLLMKQGCVRSICSYRDPMEAMASWMQVFGTPFDQTLRLFEQAIDFVAFQREHALMVRCEDIERKPADVIRDIARHLDVPVTTEAITALAASLDKETVKTRYDNLKKEDANVHDTGFSFYDRETFFHRRHVRGGDAIASEAFFSDDERAIIRETLVLPGA
jgi:Sulfotransferase domain